LKGRLAVAAWLLDAGCSGDLWDELAQSFDRTTVAVAAGNPVVTEWLHAQFTPKEPASDPTR
jgi:hypothetical protein